MKKKTHKSKYIIALAVLLIAGYTYVETKSNTITAVFDNTATTTPKVEKISTFDDGVEQYVENSLKMVKALKEAKDITDKQAEVLERAEQAYKQATDNYNESVRNYNALLDSTKLTHPAALDIFYTVGNDRGLFTQATQ